MDFLWKLQAQKELQDMRELRHYNTQLLKNILPDHVAAYFLTHDRNSEVTMVGVRDRLPLCLCAGIANGLTSRGVQGRGKLGRGSSGSTDNPT